MCIYVFHLLEALRKSIYILRSLHNKMKTHNTKGILLRENLEIIQLTYFFFFSPTSNCSSKGLN